MLTPSAYDPRFMKPVTLCCCGHILQCCADCNAHYAENRARYESCWRWFVNHSVFGSHTVAGTINADAAEADDRAFFGLLP